MRHSSLVDILFKIFGGVFCETSWISASRQVGP